MKYCKRKVIQGSEDFYSGSLMCDIFVEGTFLESLSKYLSRAGTLWYPTNESAIEIENLKLFERTNWEF